VKHECKHKFENLLKLLLLNVNDCFESNSVVRAHNAHQFGDFYIFL